MQYLNSSKLLTRYLFSKRTANYAQMRFSSKMSSDFVKVSPDVQDAVARGRAVVALESTILTHGLPIGTNLKAAKHLESLCDNCGVLGSTVGVIDGQLKVGLTEEELTFLCSGDPHLKKISRRDLPNVFANSQSGGTTVSSTLIGCHAASIPIFATGGLGGVHRHVEKSWDISADLEEISHTPVAVVCSGVKSILDIPKTLQFLETKGVNVVSFKSEYFPTFFSNSTEIKSPFKCQDLDELTRLLLFVRKSSLNSGLIIANPLPENLLVDSGMIEEAIQESIETADKLGISGKDFTPFVLDKVRKLTDGKSLQINLSLVENNVKLACELAKSYRQKMIKLRQKLNSCLQSSEDVLKKSPLVIGGINIDMTIKPTAQPSPASVPSEINLTLGGVGKNIAEALHYLKCNPNFISCVGNDPLGKLALETIPVGQENILISDTHPTSIYSLVLHPATSELLHGYAQSQIHHQISVDFVAKNEDLIKSSSVVVHDGNISPSASRQIFSICKQNKISLIFEPTDYAGCSNFAQVLAENPKVCKFITPNLKELIVLNDSIGQIMSNKRNDERFGKSTLQKAMQTDERVTDDNCLHLVAKNSEKALRVSDSILVSLGHLGIIVASENFSELEMTQLAESSQNRLEENTIGFYHFKVKKIDDAVSCSGAGDSFVAGFVSSFFQRKKNLSESVKFGLQCAKVALKTVEAVNPDIKRLST